MSKDDTKKPDIASEADSEIVDFPSDLKGEREFLEATHFSGYLDEIVDEAAAERHRVSATAFIPLRDQKPVMRDPDAKKTDKEVKS
jgi:hypothetical protein